MKLVHVCTRCRLCGIRNELGAQIVRVWSPDDARVARSYYCLDCWLYLSARAQDDIPGLAKNSTEAAVDFVHALIHPGSRPTERAVGTQVDDKTDTVFDVPVSQLRGRVLLEPYYPTGKEREEYLAGLQQDRAE